MEKFKSGLAKVSYAVGYTFGMCFVITNIATFNLFGLSNTSSYFGWYNYFYFFYVGNNKIHFIIL